MNRILQNTMHSKTPLIVNFTDWKLEPGDFFSNRFGDAIEWQFVDAAGPYSWLQRFTKIDIARLKGAFRTGLLAAQKRASLVVSHGPGFTSVCEFFLRPLGFKGPHLAFSFNYPKLPTGLRLKLVRLAFQKVDRFLVYSTIERHVYSSAFSIPIEKFDFIHWGVNPPQPEPADRPVIEGEYICAIGENSRDYKTLFEAMRALPHIKLVAVVKPHNIAGLTLPPNVEIQTAIPLGKAMNILAFSRFMVLPLAGSEVPCGHVTLVSAMYLGKAFVISNSLGVADYVLPGENAITCEAFNSDAMVEAIRLLWEDRSRCDALGERGRAFAHQYCSEASTFAWFSNYLQTKGLLTQ
jgi:glycosyltransferase involved in cell wall biosynthesis